MNTISIALVDDDVLIVALLNDFLQKQDSIEVSLTANSGEELINKLESQKKLPDILVIDLKMKHINGAEVTEFLKVNYPSIRTIVISSHYKLSLMGFMLKTGVSAFLPKGISPQQLIEIIKEVHVKGFFFLTDQLEVIREQISSKVPQPTLNTKNILTEREQEILKLICLQKTAKEIGEQLFITQRTVEGHKNKLFLKTETKNIAGLVIYAIQSGLIESNEILLS